MSNLQTDSTLKIYTNQAVSTSFESSPIDIQQVEGFNFFTNWSGGTSIVGRMELQCSPERDNTAGWVKVDGSGQRITGTEGKHTYNSEDFSYRYVKLVINLTSGNTLFNIWFNSRSRRS